MMHASIEHGAGDHSIAEKFSLIFNEAIRCHQRGSFFIAIEQDFLEFIGGLQREFSQEKIVDDQEIGGFHLLFEFSKFSEFSGFVDLKEKVVSFSLV
jgi:ubiquitin C-terminal hydrolase